MRQHERYLEKVTEESDVFRRHLIRGDELSPQQEETFGKVAVVRDWLREGYSDADVIRLAKQDRAIGVADRRARELLAMAYDIFADLRSSRNTDGLKYLYAEQFRDAANEALKDYKDLKEAKEWKEAAGMLKAYKDLMKEAAEIDGAYKETPKKEGQKRSQKFVIKRKKTTTRNRIDDNGDLISETDETEAKYEQ